MLTSFPLGQPTISCGFKSQRSQSIKCSDKGALPIKRDLSIKSNTTISLALPGGRTSWSDSSSRFPASPSWWTARDSNSATERGPLGHLIPKAGLRRRSLLVKHLNFVILLRPAALVDWDSVRSTHSCSPRAEIYLMRKLGMIIRGGTSLFFWARPELEVQGTSPNEPEPEKNTLLWAWAYP